MREDTDQQRPAPRAGRPRGCFRHDGVVHRRAQKEADPHRKGVFLGAAADHAPVGSGNAEDAMEWIAAVIQLAACWRGPAPARSA